MNIPSKAGLGTVIVTGSAGLVGSECAKLFASRGYSVVGIDNDMRSRLFGPDGSTAWNRKLLEERLAGYVHANVDIRDREAVEGIFEDRGRDTRLIVHAAAQPSHDWAARDPHADFTINANGTLNLLEAARRNCPEAAFIFTSTNKVYGDSPNFLPLIEKESRFELDPSHPWAEHGIDETMSIDRTMHSLFGASKVAADVLVQEYGRYFGMMTACFRGGCLTGPSHSGTQLHGFLAYLMRCAATGRPYMVYGYGGKQVRDNIHSRDLAEAFWAYFQDPRPGEVYNIGGGRDCNCSMLEAISACEDVAGRKLRWDYSQKNRAGDHVWWISDTRRFRQHYPEWEVRHDVHAILKQMFEANRARWLEDAI